MLSKTKTLKGFNCLKRIYLTIHNPELAAPTSPDKQAVFDQGNAVTQEARTRFPGGILIDNEPWDFVGSLKKTKTLIENGEKIIYEAAFEHNGFYARADIISYSRESKRWSLYEVKSSTKVKPEHLDDVALQTWIIAKSGLLLEKISILYLNSKCNFPNLENLFVEEDVTEKMREKYPDILPKLNEIKETLQKEVVPEIDIGPYCLEPDECEFKDHCWKKIPQFSIFNLPNIRDKKWEFYHQGIIEISDERITDLTSLQQRVLEAHRKNERIVNSEGIKASLAEWTFPLIFLDFETINPAIPRYQGCKPYSQVPFQFSVHIWRTKNSELEHKEFLHTEQSDPRHSLILSLLEACEDQGSVVAYFGKFESGRIKELAEFSPSHTVALQALSDRIVDPLPIIRDHVYDPGFKGSFSLKDVAPAILGQSFSYEKMLVGNGLAAQRAFEEIISQETPKLRKEELISATLEYCKQDTFVMVELVKWLFSQSEILAESSL